MASSIYYPVPQRGNGYREKGRANGLPSFSPHLEEKIHRSSRSMSWSTPISLPIPGVRTRRLRLLIPNFGRLHQFSVARCGRKRGPVFLCFALAAVLFTVFALTKRFGTQEKKWPTLAPSEPPTLVFKRDDLQRIWKWEIESGHYPSSAPLHGQLGLTSLPLNPGLPAETKPKIPSRYRPPPGLVMTDTVGVGHKRVYLDIQSQPPNVAYPPRPVPGSVADLDVVMKHCDFSQKKYVRDCLEVLRVGAGLDNGNRLRRGNMDDWKYIYLETGKTEPYVESSPVHNMGDAIIPQGEYGTDTEAGLTKKRGAEWEPPVNLRPHPSPISYSEQASPCDDEKPRLFHMFWAGPFTDKPYVVLLSFLFTQNVGLDVADYPEDSPVCRPKFWIWINPGPAASVPNPSATRDMFDELKKNPWAAPFLHPRFKDVIQFKLWNTTEQLDGVTELKDDWRAMRDTLFNSGGHTISVPADKQPAAVATSSSEAVLEMNGTFQAVPAPTGANKVEEDDPVNRMGSKSASSYDKLSVILSDMARFILCHRFGGIYLDADTIFLRDWEELWGWNGAFAYRWSRLEKYNTAVLRMNKDSALGTFLIRTAVKNGLDFHPMSISRYTKDAYLEGLLLRLPDALFDSAWLNTEHYQRDRPPQPFFYQFEDLFDTPAQYSAAPQALGFEGFYRGAFSYHFHNNWWMPFDPSRNWPELGPRFIASERAARSALAAAAITADGRPPQKDGEDKVEDDKRDLDWATVLKRTFEAYIRGERPNMYGEWIQW